MELIKNRLKVKWFSLRRWKKENLSFLYWFYSFTNNATKENDHFLQLSILGLNVAFKYRIQKK